MKACGTGRPFANRTPLPSTGIKSVAPRVFWAVVGSGLSLRRGSREWRFDCPRDSAHTVTLSYKDRGNGSSAVYLHCHHDEPYTDGCTVLAVLTALGCTMRDLHQQTPEAADGRCDCGAPGYRVAGVRRGRPVCLTHLLDATGQSQDVLFGKWKRPADAYPEKVCKCGEPVLVGPDGTRYVVDDADPPTRHYCEETATP